MQNNAPVGVSNSKLGLQPFGEAMDPASFVREQWQVISTYPLTFVLLIFVTASVAVAITRAVMGGALEASREG